jgi:hypothetical protein
MKILFYVLIAAFVAILIYKLFLIKPKETTRRELSRMELFKLGPVKKMAAPPKKFHL